jgi:hypothetical protein
MCLDDASVLKQINALGARGIETIVVGIPGTEAYTKYLDEFAVAGGMPVADPSSATKYFAATNAASLGTTIAQVIDAINRNCSVALESAPSNSMDLNLLLDCAVLPYDSLSMQGWHYNGNATAPAIVIDGNACQRLQSGTVGRVDVLVGCPRVGLL